MDKQFKIYRSSAGSGKTYTLTREYLKIALSRPGAFRSILGVTFTNKATEEMKSRIVSVLREMAEGKQPQVQKDLEEALGKTAGELQKAAAYTLTDILHQYGRFAVVTIDSFFHQVIRAFAKEMGLQGSFSIDLEADRVMQHVVDDLMLKAGEEENKGLRKWLTQFSEEMVEEGKSWDVSREINQLASEVLKDDFKPYAGEVLKLGSKTGFFTEFKKELDKVRFSFEKTIQSKCGEGIQLLKKHGVDFAEFKGSANSPASLFHKLQQEIKITDAQRKKVGQHDQWIKAKDPKEAILSTVINDGLAALYDEIITYHDQNLIYYQSAQEVGRYIYTFAILTEVNRRIQDYRDENEVMLIADLPDFLNQIINDSDTPYIYEKVGSLFQHYLIDEFQDTSGFQWNNFKPLVRNATDEEGGSGMVVGDVKQSIYRWRGGDWQLLQSQVREDMGGAELVHEDTLETNWRSAYQVVDFNNLFFVGALEVANDYFQKSLEEVLQSDSQSRIEERIAEVLSTYADVVQNVPESKDSEEGLVNVTFLPSNAEEGDWKDLALQKTIAAVEESQRQGYQLRDIAILTRGNRDAKKIAQGFVEYASSEEAAPDLKYDVVSSEALYLTSSHLVRFMISLIKWLHDEANTIVLSEWLFEWERYILKSEKTETEIFSIQGSWEHVVPKDFVSRKDYLKTLPLFEMVEELIRVFGLNDHTEEFTYLQGFQDAMLDYSKNERGDIPSFLEWWEEVKDKKSIKLSDDNDAVKIMTVHKSKGLEFPIVIIPYLSWNLDHDHLQENILWCPAGTESPYNQLPVVPLHYSPKLANTHWAMDYYNEKLKAFLDSLNLLYVAFTRPVDALFVFASLPKPPRGQSEPDLSKINIKGVSEFTLATLKDRAEFDTEKYVFTKGRWPSVLKPRHGSSSEFALEKYHCHTWRDKASIQVRNQAELGENIFNEQQKQGIKIHELLSRVKYSQDLNKLIDSEEKSLVTEVVNHPKIKKWFDPQWQVDTEVGFLLPDGSVKRIDRMNRSKTETIVIDFKTGKPRDKDKRQVKEYLNLLAEMKLAQPKGYLVYLTDMEVVEI